MKAIHKLFAFLLMICIPLFTSCEIPEIPQSDIPVSDAESATDAETTVPPPSERFTVKFDENEAFPTETERSASERIDPAIRKAVELLNTIGDESIPVSDCDYLKKNDYAKAKQVLESLPESVTLKNDAIAVHLKGRDQLNGAILARCNHLQGLYSAAMREGDAWFRMHAYNVTFRDYAPADYIPKALKAYRKGLAVLEAFLLEGKSGQDRYLWDGMQTFHCGFYRCIAACYKKLGQIEECEKAIAEAYRIVSTSWKDFEKHRDRYMKPFHQYLKDYDLAEYIR